MSPTTRPKKSLRVLERKLEWLAREAEFSVTINSVLGVAVKNPEDALPVARRARSLGFHSTVSIAHDGAGPSHALPERQFSIYQEIRRLETATDQPSQSVVKSQEILAYIKNSGSYGLFVLLDFRRYLDDDVHVRFLKDIALDYARHHSTVVLVGTALQLPEELRPFTARFHLPLPTPAELRTVVCDVAADWGAQHNNREVHTTNKALDMLVRNLAGLTATDARRLAFRAIDDDGAISESDIPEVMRAKYELLGQDSPLSFEYETARFAEIGGMQRLRQWLEVRKSFFQDETPEKLDPPRGMLLLGVQGCGKSLAAKAAAGIFGVPVAAPRFWNSLQQILRRNRAKLAQSP